MSDETAPPRRRPRYAGKYPRRFEDKYKEHDPTRYPETFSRVLAAGKTPAGSHVPIMVDEILRVLAPRPGERAIDCTLGYGGHATALLARLRPGGHLVGLDVDPIEQPRTEIRLRDRGFGEAEFSTRRANFAALPRVVAETGPVDLILADLGVSSMQIDTPERGFSVKVAGPLDMRMHPGKGLSAAEWLRRADVDHLAAVLAENADEPRAIPLARGLAGRTFATTVDLAAAVRALGGSLPETEVEKSVRRVFQAVRIVVNDELGSLDTLLRHLPACLAPGGRAAILSFHSGEDRRVKKSFAAGLLAGVYDAVSPEVTRASSAEIRSNPRAASAKLRWAKKPPALS